MQRSVTAIRQVAAAHLAYHLGLAVGELRIAEDRADAHDYFDRAGRSIRRQDDF